jgi:hypothetical protein
MDQMQRISCREQAQGRRGSAAAGWKRTAHSCDCVMCWKVCVCIHIPAGNGEEPLDATTAGGRDPYCPKRLCTEAATGQVQSACSWTVPDPPKLLQAGAWALSVPISVRP